MNESLQSILNPSASGLAESIYQWAKDAGALVESQSRSDNNADLFYLLGLDNNAKLRQCGQVLAQLKIQALTADDETNQVGVLVKNQISNTALGKLPGKIKDVTIRYYGHSAIAPIHPVVPQTTNLGGSRFYLDQGHFCCGSSITVAPVQAAGTMGALVRFEDGTLGGLTNNHVTGDCNHSRPGMHILCPAPMDADPHLPPPTGIGTHHSFIKLESGDPSQVAKQEFDVALFNISNSSVVSSYQGARSYDTPAVAGIPTTGQRVKKIGRTTGLTYGTVAGKVVTPLNIPYVSAHFKSTVHFTDVWAVAGLNGEKFCDGGDSGSLIITEDGSQAIGLLFAQGDGMTYMTPIHRILSALKVTLVSGHNL